MIPKILHYVWLGGMNDSIEPYLDTWREFCPDYEIIRWDEKRIDFSNTYLENARQQKNWANISNYVRLTALEEFGGIYLDTDVKIIKSLNNLLNNKCFLGFQFKDKQLDWVNNAVMGAVPNHWFVRKAKEFLLSNYDGYEAANDSSPTMITKLLVSEGLRRYSSKGIKIKDITIYPVEKFYPYAWNESKKNANITSETVAIHEWKKRWVWKQRPRLVMTLLVRDEQDIIEKNICFHLSHGVDHIIAMDNNSVDMTKTILKKYERLGVLTYLHQPDNTYEQSKWVSQMADMAVTKYHATHIIHADADEFWYPDSGNLKEVLPYGQEILHVNSLTYLPPTSIEKILGMRWAVIDPIPYFAQIDRELSYRYLLYRYQPKIITTNKYTHIMQGNHGVIAKKKIVYSTARGVLIHHFPIRSFTHFRNKVIKGGKSYLQNPNQDPSIGWQWKEWYLYYQAHILFFVYLNIRLTYAEKLILNYRKIIRRISVPKSIRFARLLWEKRRLSRG